MREVAAEQITALVADLYQQANFRLPDDVLAAIRSAAGSEESELGRQVLSLLLENADVAASERLPLCQDTGSAVVFVELGEEVIVSGGSLAAAVDAGVARAREEGCLRASVVSSPCFERRNTGDNTPAVLHVETVAGDGVTVTVMPKGGGSENAGATAMLKPADGAAGVARFVVDTVGRTGAGACPPLFLGVGIGGTLDRAVLLAKKALLRPVGQPAADARLAALEAEILERVNGLGIGPAGLGGTVTCLGVAVEEFPCHIASLPVALNVQCNAARRASGRI